MGGGNMSLKHSVSYILANILKLFPSSTLNVTIIGTTFIYVVSTSDGNTFLFMRSSSNANSKFGLDAPILEQI